MPEPTELEKLVKKNSRKALEDNLAAEMRLYGLPTPLREYIFHPLRKWRFDFAWPDLKIALEVEGGIFMGGGHNRGGYMEQSYEKHNEAARLGWKVFKFGTSQVRRKKNSQQSSKALEYMFNILKEEPKP